MGAAENMTQDSAALIERMVDGLNSEVGAAKQYWCAAPPASGGSFFLDGLQQQLASTGQKVFRLRLPTLHLDSGEHVLGQLIEFFGPDAAPALAFDAARPTYERARELASQLANDSSSRACLLVRVPASWTRRESTPHAEESSRIAIRSIRALLESRLPAVVVSTENCRWLREDLERPEPLPPLYASEEFLREASLWGDLAEYANKLAGQLGGSATHHAPLDLRLGVACAALGEDVEQLASAFEVENTTASLVQQLRRAFKRSETNNSVWKCQLRRLSLPRFPVPREVIQKITSDDACTEQLRDVIDKCLTYDTPTGTRFHEALRGLAKTDENSAEVEPNRTLASHYASMDGESEIRGAARHAIPWLEQLHHLAHSGLDALDEWQRIPRLSHLSRWELAWSLSVEHKAFDAAASVYRGLAEEYPNDAYSHHYWAWNLDQCGKERATVADHYNRAVELDPTHAWWNSRYIGFLLRCGRIRDAEHAWRRALKHLDPTGDESRGLELPMQLHKWVAREALDAAALDLAEEVLSSTGEQNLERIHVLRMMWDELRTMLDVDRLNESVYPASVPYDLWWRAPLLLDAEVLPKKASKASKPYGLRSWYPGRVHEIRSYKHGKRISKRVVFVFADPETAGTDDPPVLFTRETSFSDATRLASGAVPTEGRFVELGIYGEGEERLRYHATVPDDGGDASRFSQSLRYLRNMS